MDFLNEMFYNFDGILSIYSGISSKNIDGKFDINIIIKIINKPIFPFWYKFNFNFILFNFNNKYKQITHEWKKQTNKPGRGWGGEWERRSRGQWRVFSSKKLINVI